MIEIFANHIFEYYAMGEGYFVYKIFLAMAALFDSEPLMSLLNSIAGLSILIVIEQAVKPLHFRWRI